MFIEGDVFPVLPKDMQAVFKEEIKKIYNNTDILNIVKTLNL